MTATLRPSAVLRAVRAAGTDAPALYALSVPFMRSGALRERTPDAYRRAGDTFLMVRAEDGAAPGRLDACVALRALAPEAGRPSTGLLHNLCVRTGRQGAGLGSLLVTAVLAEARRRGLRALVTATTGGGELFLRHGFREITAAAAPAEWAAGLDPARHSRVFTREI
ncbi:GNAT family N-acetyltransferase [Streptomyces sp. BE20]|uniref:GNAT family N-acetyltransferase n=1 Tax=Streptomyces sp. BE20 TaxID=3002525 RepID=UPI002E75CDC7|nr:GNAT family N-acetyltransferase [Streptomyces sp. BE20]MEE1826265.1 GNAT family N-acetyltransferase [Streptomyces sp. BE20]